MSEKFWATTGAVKVDLSSWSHKVNSFWEKETLF